jgi:predicted O-methyltransferase YrrM
MPSEEIAGQLNAEERRLLTEAVLNVSRKPEVILEVGTWLGGGSTLYFLRALEKNGQGHLWGIEADQSIYERMLENIRRAAPEAVDRFTPLFGFSRDVIPAWLHEQGPEAIVDLVFLDGGNNPMEQINEFKLLADRIPIGGQLLAHDAKLRKGKWLVSYLSRLDNWESQLHDVSTEGLFCARKVASHPSDSSLRLARLHLLRMRLQPAEVAAALLPAKVCGFILGLMPETLRRRLAEGR